VVHIDFDQFDDELQRLLGLMEEGEIALNDDVLKISIKSLYLKKAITVDKGTSLQSGIDTMLARNIGSVLVLDDKKLCGILTERDLLFEVAGQDIDLEKKKVDDYMSPEPAILKESDTVEDAIRYMYEKGYRHITIVDDSGAPAAVISIKDIVGYLVEFFPTDILNLPPHPIRVGTRHRFGA